MTKRFRAIVDNSIDPQIYVTIDLVLTAPAKASGPVPVILELAFAKDFERASQRPLPRSSSAPALPANGESPAAGPRQGLGIRRPQAHQLSGR